jgi:inhibitor of KinA sporulation pathway (predicted exonuclease)
VAEELRTAGGALLIDLELTCWEDSLRTGWADPARPAEVIEIGLAVYDATARAVRATFTTLVRPHVNPVLSDYCVNVVNIAQPEIDAAEDLPFALARVEQWLQRTVPSHWPTCGWGPLDRERLATNALMRNLPDPLTPRAHIDLCAVMTAFVGHPTPIDRDVLRRMRSLPPNPRRHRALDDALDLTHFLSLLPADAA